MNRLFQINPESGRFMSVLIARYNPKIQMGLKDPSNNEKLRMFFLKSQFLVCYFSWKLTYLKC